MKAALITLFVGLVMAPLALGDVFGLAATELGAYPYTDTGMIVWISPRDGTVTVSGQEEALSGTDGLRQNVGVYWRSVLTLPLGPLTPANALSNAFPIFGGTVGCYGYGDPRSLGCAIDGFGQPVPFGTPNIINQDSSPSGQVSKGDVIIARVEEGDSHPGTALLNLNVQLNGDFAGSGGTESSPVQLSNVYTGLSGNLDNSSDWYEFYWGGGDLTGTASAGYVWNGASTSASLNLALYSIAGDLLDSGTAGSIDWNLPAGKYKLEVSDTGDPPYNIEFNSPISGVPEADTNALLGATLAGLAFLRWISRGLRGRA